MSYFRERIGSFRPALQGLVELFRTAPNARIHLVVATIALALGWFFRLESLEWISIVLCIGMVLAAEAFNSAMEDLTDLASPGIHPLAGKAKDLAAAAVLLTAAASVAVGTIIFLPKLLTWINP